MTRAPRRLSHRSLPIIFLYDVFGKVIEYVVSTLSGEEWRISDLPLAAGLILGVWAFFYCAYL